MFVDLNCRPLPMEIAEISADWLTAALRTYAPDVVVSDFQIVNMIRGTCTKIRLRLSLNDAGKRAGIPALVILKGGFEPHSREMGYMHEKEIQVYRDIAPHLKLGRPSCYFADYDPETRQGVIIMEDLAARGVRFCNPLAPQAHDEVARRLSALANFHAQTWGSAEFSPSGRWAWVDDVLLNQRRYFDQFLKPDIWAEYIALPRGAAASMRFHSLDWMDSALDRMAVLSRRLPHAIIHGDTHLGNLYIDPDGTPGFFDSLGGRAPAMLEITYHIGCALDTADRSRWERALVRHYLGELRACGVDAPSFDEAMRQYGIFLAYGYAVFIVNSAVFQTEAVNTAYTARFSAAMIEHNTIDLLNSGLM